MTTPLFQALESRSYLSGISLDPVFGTGGKVVDWPVEGEALPGRSIAVQPDGKIVVAAPARAGKGVEFLVRRYLSNGKLDVSFGRRGSVMTHMGYSLYRECYPEKVVVGRDGKIVVVGRVRDRNPGYDGGQFYQLAVVRYTADGELDRTFNGKGKRLIAMPQGEDWLSTGGVGIGKLGKIHIGGSVVDYQWVSYQNSPDGHYKEVGRTYSLLRLLPDGSTDASFGDQGQAWGTQWTRIGDLVLLRDGGVAATADGAVVLRFKSDGTLNQDFGGGGWAIADLRGDSGTLDTIAVTAQGKLVTAGTCRIGDRTWLAVARFHSMGEADINFGEGGTVRLDVPTPLYSNYGAGLAIQPKGGILLAGQFGQRKKGVWWTHAALVRVTREGGLDYTFGEGGMLVTGFPHNVSIFSDVAITEEGQILAGGLAIKGGPNAFTNSYRTAFVLARYRPK